jgi:hypothetical membrane protein
MSDRLSSRLLVLLPAASALWLAGSVLILGALRPGYSHAAQFMSELGASGTSLAWAMNFLGFIPAELFILGFVVLAARRVGRAPLALTGLGLTGLYAAALIVDALFPCDATCWPADPSLTHDIHIAAGALAYLAGLAAVGVLGLSVWREGGRALGLAGPALALAGLGLLGAMDPDSPVVGLVQRALESVIFVGLIGYGAWLERREAA